MEGFGPLFAVIILCLFCVPLSRLNQAGKKKAPGKAAPRRAAPAAPSPPEAPAEAEAEPALTPLRPTVSVTKRDDTVYQGSLNAETGEGFDPCHDEQMEPLTELRAEAPSPGEAEPAPGLRLSFGGDEVIRGLVMSEILKRRA